MKRISNYLKILLAVILVIALTKNGSVEGVEESKQTVSTYGSIEIAPSGDAEVNITNDMFELTSTDWIYKYYNSDGNIQSAGIIDTTFQGITLGIEEYILCAPLEEEAVIDYTYIKDIAEITYNEFKYISDYYTMDYLYSYEINASEEEPVYIFTKGDFKVDLNYLDADGNILETVLDTTLPTTLNQGEVIQFTASEKGSYDIKQAVIGSFYFTVGQSGDVSSSCELMEKYDVNKTDELVTDGTIYTITNNANYAIEIGNFSNVVIETEVYDASGALIETFNSSDCAAVQAWFYTMIPAGGKAVYFYEANPDEVLISEYLSVYEGALTFGEIIIPEGDITESGIYRLDSEMEYTLGNGKWTIEGDSTVYNGGVRFYIEQSGDYELTLQ